MTLSHCLRLRPRFRTAPVLSASARESYERAENDTLDVTARRPLTDAERDRLATTQAMLDLDAKRLNRRRYTGQPSRMARRAARLRPAPLVLVHYTPGAFPLAA